MLMPCGKTMAQIGIQLSDGLSISAFIGHLETCKVCDKERAVITDKLNALIGGNAHRRD